MNATIADRTRLDEKGRTLLAELEANKAALLHELATIPGTSRGAIDRRAALNGVLRRIDLLLRPR